MRDFAQTKPAATTLPGAAGSEAVNRRQVAILSGHSLGMDMWLESGVNLTF